MRIDIVTLFPGMFDSVLGSSILQRAAKPIANPADASEVREPVVSYHLHDPRQHTLDKHGKVDQSPYGGGPGMVLQCQPIFDCVSAVEAQAPERQAKRIVLTPKGVPLTQPLAEALANEDRLLLIAGHYEGFDQRLLDELEPLEISIGDYVLTGGELPAMVLIDAVVRLIPGVLGDSTSAHHDSFSPGSENEQGQRLLDHPHYTRPPQWRDREVPPVLLSGDHAKIDAWRKEKAHQLTQTRRPDLLQTSPASANIFKGSSAPFVVLREALPGDGEAIDAVLRAAFDTEAEAKLVAALREQGDLPIELVAEVAGQVVGHIAFSPITIQPPEDSDNDKTPHFSNPRFRALALAPLAVHPAHQRNGIGQALTRLGRKHCEQANLAALFVLGDPAYYQPLGFEPAGPRGFTNPFTDSDAFQICLLKNIQPALGQIQYAPAFDALEH